MSETPTNPKNTQVTEGTAPAGTRPQTLPHVSEERDKEVGIPLSKFKLNYSFQPKDPRDKKLKYTYEAPVDEALLPSKVDLSQEWGPIYDQGTLGSCVANSCAYCIRWVRIKKKLSLYEPSRLFIYYFGRLIEGLDVNEDSGMFIRSAYKAVQKYSVCSEDNWAYDPEHVSTQPDEKAISAAKIHRKFEYLKVSQKLPYIKKCLADGYPISFGCTIYDSFMTPEVAKSGVWVYDPKRDTEETSLGGHAMSVVGHDDGTRMFTICNSWGPQWGKGGFCQIPYDYLLDKTKANDFWSPRTFD